MTSLNLGIDEKSPKVGIARLLINAEFYKTINVKYLSC